MNRVEFARIRQVFHAVLEQATVQERDALLETLVAGDDDLRRQVRTLLEAHARAGQFLGTDAMPPDCAPPPLSPGERVGSFEVERQIGEGGMGRVYRARDTRLDRTVALKVLTHVSAAGGLAQEWLRHEARLLSQLNHPHICTLHDIIETTSGATHSPCLVMEYLEGETLETRLQRARMSNAEVHSIATAIASALDAAHSADIVHGDLKPGNVMLLRQGGIKLLDFGLARVAGQDSLGPDGSSARTTRPGGTPPYMAPEIILGEPPDTRSDLFALGRVFLKLLDAVAPSGSDDQHATLRWVALRCVAEDPADRWQSARDLLAILRFTGGHAEREAPRGRPGRRRARLTWAAATLGVTLVGGGLGWRWFAAGATERAPVTRLSIPVPPDIAEFRAVRLSPDGRQALLVGMSRERTPLAYLQDLSAVEPRRLSWFGNQMNTPAWSPNGRELLAATIDGLRAWDVRSGTSRLIAQVPRGAFGSWSSGGVILLDGNVDRTGLFRVPAGGGRIEPETSVDRAGGELQHVFPHFLPDGEHYLFVVYHVDPGRGGLYLGQLGSAARWRLSGVTTPAIYRAGHVLWVQGSALFAQRLDLLAGQLVGDAVTLMTDYRLMVYDRSLTLSASTDGTIAAPVIPPPLGRFTWRDRTGRTLGTAGETGVYDGFEMSRDGTQVVVSRRSALVDDWALWRLDLRRQLMSRLTTNPGLLRDPRWSPDGTRVLASSFHPAAAGAALQRLVIIGADGAERVLPTEPEGRSVAADAWTPDGREIVYHVDAAGELRAMAIDRSAPSRVLARSTGGAAPGRAVVSPDGRFIAYQAYEKGERGEIWVDTFPATGARVQVSREGGVQPTWRVDGRELYFLALDGTLQVAAMRPGRLPRPSAPARLFDTGLITYDVLQQYAPAPDGSRFLLLEPQPPEMAPRVDLLFNAFPHESR